jgi:hypothetical protein
VPKIALIVTTMSVALLAYYGFEPAPAGKDADAELSIYPQAPLGGALGQPVP